MVALVGCSSPEDPRSSSSVESAESSRRSAQPVEAIPLATDGSLAALTAEVRQLRIAVEELARSQTQAETLSAYFSAQQSRIERISARLDAVRPNIESANRRNFDIDTELQRLSGNLSQATNRETRTELEERIRRLREEQTEMAGLVQQWRGEESELLRELRVEQARWDELVDELDQQVQTNR